MWFLNRRSCCWPRICFRSCSVVERGDGSPCDNYIEPGFSVENLFRLTQGSEYLAMALVMFCGSCREYGAFHLRVVNNVNIYDSEERISLAKDENERVILLIIRVCARTLCVYEQASTTQGQKTNPNPKHQNHRALYQTPPTTSYTHNISRSGACLSERGINPNDRVRVSRTQSSARRTTKVRIGLIINFFDLDRSRCPPPPVPPPLLQSVQRHNESSLLPPASDPLLPLLLSRESFPQLTLLQLLTPRIHESSPLPPSSISCPPRLCGQTRLTLRLFRPSPRPLVRIRVQSYRDPRVLMRYMKCWKP